MTFEFGGEIAWRPTPEYIERTDLRAVRLTWERQK